jgi:methylmalonyl-CoA mutase
MNMTGKDVPLGRDFETPSYETWRELAEKALKGGSFEKRLISRSYDGFEIQPIYSDSDWNRGASGFPGIAPFTRGAKAASPAGSWEVRQSHVYPDAKIANAQILRDLNGGVTAIELVFDGLAQRGHSISGPPGSGLIGERGIPIYDLTTLNRVLADVHLSAICISLKAGEQSTAAAAMLAALWRQQELTAELPVARLNADPYAALARTGCLATSLEEAQSEAATLARFATENFGNVRAIAVDTACYHDSGATEAQDVAFAISTGLANARAMENAGLSLKDAFRQIEFSIAVGVDFFLSIAKLRALRKTWSRITDACGVADPEMQIHVRTANRILTQHDPWVNILRTTTGCFAAALGGANAITVAPFDAAIDAPEDLSLRIARNTHAILAEEASLSHVIDPAGGSWFVESITDIIAADAWSRFQEIETLGGFGVALLNGNVGEWVSTARTARQKDVATRRVPITGVSEFPNLHEEGPGNRSIDEDTLRQGINAQIDSRSKDRNSPGLDSQISVASVAKKIDAVTDGAFVWDLAIARETKKLEISVIPASRLAEQFELLRAASALSQQDGKRHAVFLANWGAPSETTARSTFATNFYAVGGIDAEENSGFNGLQELEAAFRSSGTLVAVICSTDAKYSESAADIARTLKNAGAIQVVLAGKPKEIDEFIAAGIDDFIYTGCDALALLRRVHLELGIGAL